MKDIYIGPEGEDVEIDALPILKLAESNVLSQSIIVCGKEIAKRLLQKYIVNGLEFEINISYLEEIKQLEALKLVHLFDESIQSLALFVQTAKYKQIEKELEQKAMKMEDEANNKRDNNE
eukprot:272052_1